MRRLDKQIKVDWPVVAHQASRVDKYKVSLLEIAQETAYNYMHIIGKLHYPKKNTYSNNSNGNS
jgi:hypothetical protein